MKRINVLDNHTSNKIAAGEVVERPSSVVKELLENSIDANAKNITIEIEDGGVSLIKIIDDGDGIHSEDVSKAFLPHATSKIGSVEDIYSINTLGFRGEALPSIASVSKVKLKSKTSEDEIGREIVINGGVILSDQDSGMNKGTSIEVTDLFYNIPARKKFLKTYSREGAIINDIITRIALSNPDISIKFYNRGKKILHTYGNGELIDVIRTVYGKSISENSIYFENIKDEISIYGYIGKEEIAKGSRNNQSIFVNGRYIKNKMIVTAVENAFKSFATVSKFPFFILFIEVYPEFVDVNIHPTKADIKFKDDRAIFKIVFDAVHLALKQEVFDRFKLPEENSVTKAEEEEVESISFNLNTLSKPNVTEKIFNNITTFTIDESELKKQEDIYNSLKENPKIIIKENSENNDVMQVSKNLKETEKESINTLGSEDTAKFPKLRIIGQFNKLYILAEFMDVLYLIDQHAAHEKILFEKYMKEIEERSIIVQPVLVPILIDLNSEDYLYYEENKEIFNNSGFKIEDFGGNTLAIKEVPYFIGKLNSKHLFLEMLENIKLLGSGKPSEVKYNKIATMACKAAVKANDLLSEIEMEKLIEDLRFIDDPFHCPHGRPVIIQYTSYEIDKKFKRIV